VSNINFILNQTNPLLRRFDQFEDGELRLDPSQVPFLFRFTSPVCAGGIWS